MSINLLIRLNVQYFGRTLHVMDRKLTLHRILRHFGYVLLIPFLVLSVLIIFRGDQELKVKEKKPFKRLKIQSRSIDNPSEIVPIKDSSVKPVLYQQAVSLKGLRTKIKKQRFIDLMLPAILVAKFRIKQNRKKIKNLVKKARENVLKKRDSIFLADKKKIYKCRDTNELIKKLHTHPVSIVLAQAALECGWGTSRFFVKGNNVFGIWSYDANEPRIKASYTRGDKRVYVRKYDNLALSIQDYFRTIARVPSYEKFVEKRLITSDPFKLIPHLKPYSELRKIYVKRLENMIRLNNFTKYDDYYIDTASIKPAEKLLF